MYSASVHIHILVSWPDLDQSSGSNVLQGDKIVREVRAGCD